MAIQTIDFLKEKFETGDRPIWLNFRDLIDSCLNTDIRVLTSPDGIVRLRVNLNSIDIIGDVELDILEIGSVSPNNLIVKGNITAGVLNLTGETFVTSLDTQAIETLQDLLVSNNINIQNENQDIGSPTNRFLNANANDVIQSKLLIFDKSATQTPNPAGTTLGIDENNDIIIVT
jgi:hypothetical protein